MADSPLLGSDGVIRVMVTSNGRPLPEAAAIRRIEVHRALNKVPTATLVMSDGDMANETFPISESDAFVPGAEVSIKAGYGEQATEIFKGIVMRHSLRIDGDNDAALIIECRDPAIRMTVGCTAAQYIDQSDSDVMNRLIGAAGLVAQVAATTQIHPNLVQLPCSDWDFLLARAEALGFYVAVSDGTVSVGPPATAGEAVLKVTYGVDLIALQADLDAHHQFATVTARAWDMATQAVVNGSEARPAALNAQGNLSQAALAEALNNKEITLQTGAPWPQPSLSTWAAAVQQKSGLARLCGRMTFQGSALAAVDRLIELGGVGGRFNGLVYVSGLTHRLEAGNWLTDVDFGMPMAGMTPRAEQAAPSPGRQGLHSGVVLKLESDPLGQQRIQVSVPSVGIERIWARLAQLQASKGFGSFFLPEVGDEVLLGWFDQDPDFPVVLGSFYSSKHLPPYALAAENDIKAFVTRSKCKLAFDDDRRRVILTTPGMNQVVLSDDTQSIVITDQSNNRIEMTPGGITLTSGKDIVMTAAGKITLAAGGTVEATAMADLKLSGLNVSCDASIGFIAKGTATAALSAAGQVSVKGAIVLIN